jgi:membrane protein implicated in regulation of membrane protease activity
MNGLMLNIVKILMLLLSYLSVITSFLGPKSWLKVSGVCAFLVILLLFLSLGFNFETILWGICFGILTAFFIMFLGWYVKIGRGNMRHYILKFSKKIGRFGKKFRKV